MRGIKRLTALGLVTMMTALNPIYAYASTVPEGYDAETWQKLQDNVLEYGEIYDLVKEYNPAIKMLNSGIAAETAPITNMVEDMRDVAENYEYLYREAKDLGEDIVAEMYRKVYADMKKEADKTEKSLSSKTRSQKNKMQKEMASTTQGLMIGYHQSLAARDMMQTVAELAEAGYASAQTQFGLQMATETDVKEAEKNMLDAQANLKQLDDSIVTLRQNLCIMTGWSYDANPEIGALPDPDFTRIDTMNPEVDFTKAKGNNYAIRAIPTGFDWESDVQDAETALKTSLENLYQEVLKNRAAYEAAATAYQGAQITMNGADTKMDLGMLGRPEYLSQKMAFQQQKMTYVQARLTLLQSIETYGWAVDGLADIQ